MVGNDILKIERGRGFSGLAGVRATTLAGVMKTALRVTMMLALLLTMPSAALAQGTEQSETIATTCGTTTRDGLTVEGTHFTISNGNLADYAGMTAYRNKGGITVTAKGTEWITKVVITCGDGAENVTDETITVSSGKKTIGDGGTITVENVNATTFNLKCSVETFAPLFNQFVVYYLGAAPPTYSVSLKDGTEDADNWKAKAGTGDGEAKALPLEGVAEGEKVTLQYEGRKRVMSVRATKLWDGDLSKLTGKEPEGYATATDGMTITGKLADGVNVKVTIAAGATVTLKDATISGTNDEKYKWAGLTCLGDATIVLSGTNSVKGFYQYYPGIHVPVYKTLTIRGDGSLDAQSNGWGAGIGGGRGNSGGNITIEGGTIKATGGNAAAGIGGGFDYWCGNILIKGGSVEAKGGYLAAGIGGGYSAFCVAVTITNTVTKVTATAGEDATYSIGKSGDNAECGAVTVGCTLDTDGKPEAGSGMVYNDGIATSPYTYWGVVVPLTMEALTDGTIKVVVDENNLNNKVPTAGMQYAVNDGEKKTIYTTTEIDVEKGDRVTFYGNDTFTDCYHGTKISGGSAEVMVYGNIMSLMDETGFASANALSQEYAFCDLFDGNTTLKDASGLLLPATTLAPRCYFCMFDGCSALTAAPELPAKTLTTSCYYAMFYGCNALTAAPELPATELAELCYTAMFSGCSELTAAPKLPATELVEWCYSNMFYHCTKLASVTCLATSGFDKKKCLNDWLAGAGSEAATTPMLYVAPSMTEASWNKGIFTVTAITP